MSEHSPGPWRFVRDASTPEETPTGATARRLVDVGGHAIMEPDSDAELYPDEAIWLSILPADARLIAAAPEMLALLREAMAWLDDPSAYQTTGRNHRSHVEALLARVDGK